MSTLLPSQVEPDCLADLVDDCRSVRPVGSIGVPARVLLPTGPIPAPTAGLLDGMSEYGD